MMTCDEAWTAYEAAKTAYETAFYAAKDLRQQAAPYSTVDEDAAVLDAEAEKLAWAEALAESEGERRDAIAARDALQRQRDTKQAEYDALLAEERQIAGELDHLDEARVELQAEMAALLETFDPDVESLPAYEEAKQTLAEVEAAYSERVARLYEIAELTARLDSEIATLDAEIEAQQSVIDGIDHLIADDRVQMEAATRAYEEAVRKQGEAHDKAQEAGWGPMSESSIALGQADAALEEARLAWIEAARDVVEHCDELVDDGTLPDEAFTAEEEEEDVEEEPEEEDEEEDPEEEDEEDPEEDEEEPEEDEEGGHP